MEALKEQQVYLQDSYLFSIATSILSVKSDPARPEILSLAFKETIFHPQGGGQPSDQGIIKIADGGEILPVKKLTYSREENIVWHEVDTREGLKEGAAVTLQINEELRRLSARLHSAGHLIDMGVNKYGCDWEAGKGYHFADGPYVEYSIKTWEEGVQDKLKAYLNEELNKMIHESSTTDNSIAKVYDYITAKKEIPSLPGYLPEGSDVRWVKLSAADAGCPCGGTHVKNISDIKKIIVTKIQKKGKKVKVSYQVE